MLNDAYLAGRQQAFSDTGVKLANETHDDAGIAHGLSTAQFPKKKLQRGARLEQLEHGLSHHKATEVAMDHLAEGSHDYDGPVAPKVDKILSEIHNVKRSLLGGRNPEAERGYVKKANDLFHYLPKGRLGKHIFGGAAAGGAAGYGLSEAGNEQDGALRGALYGGAAGLGVAHKTNPILRRRYEDLRRQVEMASAAPGDGLLRKLFGGKATQGSPSPEKVRGLWKELGKLDSQELKAEGLVGGGMGLGLAMGSGAALDRIRGRDGQTYPNVQPVRQNTLPYPMTYD